ncbi:MAG: SUMF1/EgtB/PvdO family nonheme iron enzyme [Chloroflexi bacterium]|nr:SUMF1/EgtB/PvdO family nonheme iron enzyme [Chloroflexota bacterium]
MKCNNCNAKLPPNAKFCTGCGAPVPAPDQTGGTNPNQLDSRVFQKVGEVKDGGTVIGTVIVYQDARVTIPAPGAVARHRAALREQFEAKRKEWGSFYIQEEGALLPIDASPYGQVGERKDLLQTLRAAGRLLVLGEPGSGKTVSLEQLAWELCEGETLSIPVLIPLRDYAEKPLAEWVMSFLRETGHLLLEDEQALKAFLDRGECRCVFLFDGLNEVAPPYRDRLRENLRLWITAYPGHPVILTSRAQGDLWRMLRDAVERAVVVQTIHAEQVRAYLTAHLGDARGNALYGQLDDRLRKVVQTPLILWLVKEAGAAGESVPGNRGELYERFVSRMLRRDTKRQMDANIPDRIKRRAMAGLAYHLGQEQRLSCSWEEAATVVDGALGDGQAIMADDVVGACARHGLLRGEDRLEFAPHQTVQEHFAALALQEMVERECDLGWRERLRRGALRLTGKEQGLTVLASDGWWMETFVQLAGLVEGDWLALEVARVNPWLAWWCVEEGRGVTGATREVVFERSEGLLRSKRVRDRRRAVQTLAQIQNERVPQLVFDAAGDEDAEVAGLAVQALVGMGEVARGLVTEALRGEEQRQWGAALRYLGAVPGDSLCTEVPNRVWESVLSQPMVWVEPGLFLMGSNKRKDSQAHNDELPQHEVTLAGYWIGHYPVTNQEYGAFIAGSGYQTQAYWTGIGWQWKRDRTQPSYWNNKQYNGPQQPVVGVTWYEAVAYCHWLNEKTGLGVRLPSEAEWEKAARGTDGRIYPWGDEFDKTKCNTDESGVGTTTTVGKYSPKGDSHYGCADMAGNVWEWCVTKCEGSYKNYRGDNDLEGHDLRVLRGGSFHLNQYGARCAARLGYYPDNDHKYLGFRVVIAPISRSALG